MLFCIILYYIYFLIVSDRGRDIDRTAAAAAGAAAEGAREDHVIIIDCDWASRRHNSRTRT